MMSIRILLLLLGISHLLLSVSAIPATRTHNFNTQYNPDLPFSTHQLEEMKEQADMDEGLIETRRMLQDYGWAEANTVHDPKIPS